MIHIFDLLSFLPEPRGCASISSSVVVVGCVNLKEPTRRPSYIAIKYHDQRLRTSDRLNHWIWDPQRRLRHAFRSSSPLILETKPPTKAVLTIVYGWTSFNMQTHCKERLHAQIIVNLARKPQNILLLRNPPPLIKSLLQERRSLRLALRPTRLFKEVSVPTARKSSFVVRSVVSVSVAY